MDALALFRLGYDHAHDALGELLAALTPDELRARPHPRLNSIAWTVLHVARNEDVVASRFLADDEQVFLAGGWATRLNIAHHHAGTGMTDAEVADVTARLDAAALVAYRAAVGGRVREAVGALSPEALDERTDPAYAVHVMGDEYFPERLAGWAAEFGGRTKGMWLAGTILAHGLRHHGEIQTIRSLLHAEGPPRPRA